MRYWVLVAAVVIATIVWWRYATMSSEFDGEMRKHRALHEREMCQLYDRNDRFWDEYRRKYE